MPDRVCLTVCGSGFFDGFCLTPVYKVCLTLCALGLQGLTLCALSLQGLTLCALGLQGLFNFVCLRFTRFIYQCAYKV